MDSLVALLASSLGISHLRVEQRYEGGEVRLKHYGGPPGPPEKFDIRIGRDQLTQLFQSLASIASLSHLDIIGCGPEFPFELLRFSNNLTTLVLSSVKVCPQKMQALLAGTRSLRNLILEHITPRRGTSWDQLVEGLALGLRANSSLKTLGLPEGPVRDEYDLHSGSLDLGPMLSVFDVEDSNNNSTLEEVLFEYPEKYIAWDSTPDADAASLVPLLSQHPFSSLVKLDVPFRHLTKNQAWGFVRALKSNTALKCLNIALGKGYYKWVLGLLGMDWTDKKLSFSYNGIVSKGVARRITSKIKRNMSIEIDNVKLKLYICNRSRPNRDNLTQEEIDNHKAMETFRRDFHRTDKKIRFYHALHNRVNGLAAANNLSMQSLPVVMSELQTKCPCGQKCQDEIHVINVLYHYFSKSPKILDFDPTKLMIPEEPRHESSREDHDEFANSEVLTGPNPTPNESLTAMRNNTIRKNLIAGLSAVSGFQLLAIFCVVIAAIFVALFIFAESTS